LIIGNVSAWAPHTHNYIADKIKERSAETNITFCFDNSANEDGFRAGMIIPDITVLDYINKPKIYQKTHSWNFQTEVLNRAESQDEKCLAYGIAAHLIADSVAHGKFMVSKIEKTGFPEYITHPVIEAKYDKCIVSKNKYLIAETGKSLDVFYDAEKEAYIENIKASLGEESKENVKGRINKLATVLKALKFIIIAEEIATSLNPSGFGCNEIEINYYMQQTEDLIIKNFQG